MEHEEQLALQFEDDTLAQPVQVGDDTPFDRSKWRVDRAQQKSRDKPDARDALADHARPKRVEVQKDVGQFGHGRSALESVYGDIRTPNPN